MEPYCDLIVLLNPAFEATRYEPLHDAARRRVYPDSQRPVFMAITARNDHATKYAFPLGRTINTILESERYTEEETDHTQETIEGLANKNAIGHALRYRTHRLEGSDGKAQMSAELGDPRSRNPCTGPSTGCNPYWVIAADERVIDGHNGIYEDSLWGFLSDFYFQKALRQ